MTQPQPPNPPPTQPPQPFTRRYVSDSAYTSDAIAMGRAGWRVTTISRDASGFVVATYAPMTMLAPRLSLRSLGGINRRWLIGGAVVGVLALAVLMSSLLSAFASPSAPGAGGVSRPVTVAATEPANAAATILANDPTTTPAPTLTPTQRYDAIAQSNCNFLANSVTSTWDAQHRLIIVTAQVGPQWDINALHTTVEQLVFNCFEGFYTSPAAAAVQEVDVTVNGPIVDQYGNHVIGAYGQASLTRITARPFNWANLDYLQAWNNAIYDGQWERNN